MAKVESVFVPHCPALTRKLELWFFNLILIDLTTFEVLEWYTGAQHDVQFLNHGIPKLVGQSPTI